MFEFVEDPAQGLTTSDLAAFVGRLARLSRDVDDAERIDQVGLLEAVKSAAAAAQARVTVAFDNSQREQQRAAGVREERVGEGIAAQVGLARRVSPFRAARDTDGRGFWCRTCPRRSLRCSGVRPPSGGR